jgi:tripartite-type tricarboxylate transporter receptor subunit TctC
MQTHGGEIVKNLLIDTAHFVMIVVALVLPGQLNAQTAFPSKTIRLVTAIPPNFDGYIRILGSNLSAQLGQPVVVENKVGGNFTIATQAVATSAPDGHTLIIQSLLALVSKNVLPALQFEPVTDFAAVARIYDRGASVLIVRTELAAKNVEELISMVKASPGKLSYGSTGGGSLSHLAAEILMVLIQGRSLHVPYKSAGDLLQGFMRGDIDFMVSVTTTALPQIRTGKVRALAVSTSARIKELPDVPTLSDVVKSDLLTLENWSGLAAPAKTPAEIVRRLNAETIKALADPSLRKVIEATGNEPAAAESPEQYAAFVRKENDKWREIVKLSGVKPE